MLLKNVLIIFVKYPQPGFVKTRLAKDIGKDKACLLYRLFVETILKRTQDKRFSRIIFYSPANKKNEIEKWLGDDLEMYPQKGKDLGERLSQAFKFSFKKGAQRVIAMGSDSPMLDNKLILKAFNRLKQVNCVLGPALDGGYYLIGFSSFCPEIFQGIPWGESRVLEKTKDKIKKLGLELSLLESHLDIDNLDDLNMFQKILTNG